MWEEKKKKHAAQIVSYQNQPRFLKQKSLSQVREPGSLSCHVAGSVFVEIAVFEVDASEIDASADKA